MQILSARRRIAAFMAAAGLALALSACGGGDSDNNNNAAPDPVPPPRTTTSVFSQGYSVGAGTAASPAWGFQDVTIPNTGDVLVTFDWTFTSSDIDLVITTPSCTNGITAYNGGCTVHGSDKAFSKPARVAFTVTSPGVVRIFVYNFATVAESGVLNVTLTR